VSSYKMCQEMSRADRHTDVPCGLRVTTGKVGRRRGDDRSEKVRVGICKPRMDSVGDGNEYHWKSKSDPADIRWQVDDEHLVRAERRGFSAWTAKASAPRSLATNAHQNPPQSRICATHREKVAGIGAARCPLFLDRTGARIHSTADQHVRLGEAAR
jgi:hypothetical protein